MWVCLYSVIRRRNNIPKNIIWLVFWLSLIAVLWDLFTGRRGWSIDYVIPAICVLAMIAMAAIAIVLRLRIEEYMIYVLLDGLFGIVPLLFLTLGSVSYTHLDVYKRQPINNINQFLLIKTLVLL